MNNSEFILFENVKHVTPEEYFKGSTFAFNTFKDKYLVEEFRE